MWFISPPTKHISVAAPNPVFALQELVDRFRDVPGVDGSVVARRDGLVIAHNLPGGADARRVAAMAAVIVNASLSAVQELERGEYHLTIVQSSMGRVVCANAGLAAIFAAVLSDAANLGLVLLRLEGVARQVEEVLEYI